MERRRWIRFLVWLAAWTALFAVAPHLPQWLGIAFAIALFAAFLFVRPNDGACFLPKDEDGRPGPPCC